MAETDKIIFPCNDNMPQFPVGYILMSASNINPSTFLKYGEWALIGNGRTILGASETDKGKETGGSMSKTLTLNNIPAHTHSLPSHTHSVPPHKHGAISNKISHNHTVTVYSSGNHTHGIIINSAGSHRHGIAMNTLRVEMPHKHERGSWTENSSYVSEGCNFNNDNNSFFGTNNFVIKDSGSHVHSASSVTAGAHNHSAGSSAWEHNHNITVNDSSAFNTTSAGSGNSGSQGSGTAFDITPSYIKLFIWERIK